MTRARGWRINENNSSLRLLADLIHERTGLLFEDNRMDLLADKLSLLLAEGNFGSYLDYFYYLRYDPQAETEWRRVQTALAVNETYFWREYDHIEAVTKVIVPCLQQERPGVPVRIWHAACATGEEPYTMAIALTEAGCYARGKIEITATDFNEKALGLALAAVYRQRSFRSIPSGIREYYFTRLDGDQYQLSDDIRARVSFSYLNLLDQDAVAQMRNYDMIICRNAFIYFSGTAVRQIVKWFYHSLNQSGYLFVAAAESLLRVTNLFELVEVGNAFGYKKRPESDFAGRPGGENG